MTTRRYKGFWILSRPYHLQATRRWTADLEIRRFGRNQPFAVDERYGTELEADTGSTGLGRRIIDGAVPGCSVDHLRKAPRRRPRLRHLWKGRYMRQLIIAGVVVFGIGTFVLLRGASFTSKQNVLEVGDIKVSAAQRETIPPWVAGGVMIVGLGMIVAGAQKRRR